MAAYPSTILTTRGDILTAGASGVPQRTAMGTSGKILQSDGTDPVYVAVSGDGTLASGGALTLANNAVTTAKITDANVTVAKLAPAVMVEATGTLTQANLLAIGTPIELIAGAGAGTVIIVDEVELFHDYAVAAYATGADVQIEYETSGANIALVADSFVTGGADQNAIIKPSTYDLDGSTGTGVGFDVTANAGKGIFVTGSNFTDGDVANIVKWRIRYHVVTLIT